MTRPTTLVLATGILVTVVIVSGTTRAATRLGDTAVVTGPLSADLLVGKTTTTTLIAGDGPDDIRVNPTTNRIYINNFDGASVSVINGSTNTVIATIPVGNQPEDMVLNQSTNRVYVLNRNSNAVIDTIPVGIGP